MLKINRFEEQLEDLLNKDADAILKARKAAFDQLTAGTGERFVLFGAGRLGRFTLAGLRKSGIEPVAFADNNAQLWGGDVEGVQVLSPQSAADQFGANALFVISVYTSAPIWKQLTEMGLKIASFAMLAWQYPQALTPHGGVELPGKILAHASEIRRTLGLWADDISHREYLGQLLWETSLDPAVLPRHLPQDEIYFADDLIVPLANEVFADCGAFDGDSIREFIKRRAGSFSQIIAIEPDPANCQALEGWLTSLPVETRERIRVIQKAVGSKRRTITFDATGTAGSSVGKGNQQVESVPLDELLKGEKPTFIKMDIEGAEPDALLGMKKILAQDAPTLAVCLYHVQEHLWQIPLLIHSLNDQYDLFLRRYADECWETVCYAVPRTRSRTRLLGKDDR